LIEIKNKLKMKNRSIPVIIVAILFILVGCAGFIDHIDELSGLKNNQNETILILFLEIVAIICGLLLLYRIGWARLLAIAWLICHIIISAFNSIPEMMAHIVFLIIVSILLFLPSSTSYFRNRNKQEKIRSM
jgi:hypothetical protein